MFKAGYREVEFNPAYYALIVRAVEEFWTGCILTDTPPEPEALEDLRAKYSGPDREAKGKVLAAEDWMQASFDELVGIKTRQEVLKERRKELEEGLEKAIMGYSSIRGKDGETLLATRIPKAPKPVLNRELLRREFEDVWNRYLLPPEPVFDEARFRRECRALYDQYLETPEEGEPEFKVNYPRKSASRRTESIF